MGGRVYLRAGLDDVRRKRAAAEWTPAARASMRRLSRDGEGLVLEAGERMVVSLLLARRLGWVDDASMRRRFTVELSWS